MIGVLLLPVLLFVFVLIGAVFLRASVGFANRFLPHVASNTTVQIQATERPIETGDESNPYRAPTVQEVSTATTTGGAIPEPSFSRAIAIVLIVSGAGLIGGILAGRFVSVRLDSLIWMLINLFVTGGIAVAVLKFMLPTTFGRATAVFFIELVVVLATWIAIYTVIEWGAP